MTQTPTHTETPRYRRMRQKMRRDIAAEYEAARLKLAQRPDYDPVWDYFLELLMRSAHPDMLQEAMGRPLVWHLCNQAPYELFHAMGVQPIRLASGCFSPGRISGSGLPVLMCPMLKAVAGIHQYAQKDGTIPKALVVPTTCDWAVKFPELAELTTPPPYFMELPHTRESEKGQQRWLEEIYALVQFLEQQTCRKLKRKNLLSSVKTFMAAWEVFGRLIDLRREGRVPAAWFFVVANSFMLDPVETWTEQVHHVVDFLASGSVPSEKPGVFLAGSPILFPNYKMPDLIDAAGMAVYADDLCSAERFWPGAVCYEDTSVHGLMRALSERYHRGCICPTFADNERRINSILKTLKQHPGLRVVFHILKGCHPFDIESIGLEKRLKQEGIKFLKIETDYVEEDSQNILTRLEAFGHI